MPTTDHNGNSVRLQKFLSMAGVCSRREGEKLITKGLVKVNGKAVTELGAKVDPESDRVEYGGKVVAITEKPVYIALNKPAGYVTSCKQKGEKVVLDLLDIDGRVFPIGRLDKDTTGLLLLTNDGRIHHRLTHPSFNHEKEYDVTVDNPIADSALRQMSKGLNLDGKKTRPAKVKRLSPKRFRIVLQEGRNRQVRRMVGKIGHTIIKLKRVRISNVRLGKLSKGTWRYLTEKEVAGLNQ